MSFDINTIENPVKSALDRLAAAGYGLDGFDEAGARDGYGRPLVKDASDMDSPPKPMQRPSTRAKALDDMQGLIRWKAGMAARGAALHPDMALQLVDIDMNNPDEKKWLYAQAEKLAELAGSGEGADYGSLVHALVEAWISGADWCSYLEGLDDIKDLLIKAVESVQEALTMAGIEVMESEVCVVNEPQGVAGSTDGIGRISHGETSVSRVFDVKTTKPRSLNDSWLSFLVQLRLYAMSECLYDPKTGSRRPFPDDFDRDKAWVIHVDWRRGVTTIYDLDLSDIDEAIELANKVANWRASAQEYVSVTQPAEDLMSLLERSVEIAQAAKTPVAVTEANWKTLAEQVDERAREDSPAPAPTTPTLPEPSSLSVARNGGREDHLDFARARVAELSEAGHGDALRHAWKANQLPGIGEQYMRQHGRPSDEQWKAINDCLQALETKAGRWVPQAEIEEIRTIYRQLPDEARAKFTEWLKATGWNGAHRFTRHRADVLHTVLRELA